MDNKPLVLSIIALCLGVFSGCLGMLLPLLGYAAVIAAIILAIVALVQCRYSFGGKKIAAIICSIATFLTAGGGLITSIINSVLGVLLNLGVIEMPF